MPHRAFLGHLIIMLIAALTPALLLAQSDSGSAIPEDQFVEGPATVDLETISSLIVPDSFIFVKKDGAIKLIEKWGNIASGNEIGLMVAPEGGWTIFFHFDRIGYVRDDEKTDLDSVAMLKRLKENATKANEERHKRGFPSMMPVGWTIAPYYNNDVKSLEWAARYEVEGEPDVVNFETRILGRYGVTNVTLACNPDSLTAVLPRFRETMANYSYRSGQTYGEYREGDKIAEYGLSALVVGGAAAVAAKTGMFKWLWKVIVVAIAGGAALFKKWFGKKESPYSKLPNT